MTQNTPPPPPRQDYPAGWPAQAQAASPPIIVQMPPQRRRSFVTWLLTVLLVGSVMLNLMLGLWVVAMAAAKFQSVDQKVLREGDRKQIVAVREIAGVIDGKAADSFSQFCRDVASNGEIKAVVLRVDSPGGGVSASDQIHGLIQQLRAQGKRVVVSMGGTAASGGYYVSAPAEEILAEPTTVTGSIGVIAQWPIIGEGLGKLGIELITMKSTNADAWKDEMSLVKPPDQRQRAHLQHVLDQMQQRFEKIVSEGRGSRLKTRPGAFEKETEPFNGKIYLADEALELGLIDSVGYLKDAIDKAASLAGIKNPHVVLYRPHMGLLEALRAQSPRMAIDRKVLDELQTPRILLMWKAE